MDHGPCATEEDYRADILLTRIIPQRRNSAKLCGADSEWMAVSVPAARPHARETRPSMTKSLNNAHPYSNMNLESKKTFLSEIMQLWDNARPDFNCRLYLTGRKGILCLRSL